MTQEQKVIFFVLGVERRSKGQYLAKVLKTHAGINDAIFTFDNRLMEVSYNPEEIAVDNIKKLTYFKDCMFISDKEAIKKQIQLLKKYTLITNIIRKGGIAWVITLLYVLVNEVLERENYWIGYTVLLSVSLLLLICYYIRTLVRKEVKAAKQSHT